MLRRGCETVAHSLGEAANRRETSGAAGVSLLPTTWYYEVPSQKIRANRARTRGGRRRDSSSRGGWPGPVPGASILQGTFPYVAALLDDALAKDKNILYTFSRVSRARANIQTAMAPDTCTFNDRTTPRCGISTQ